LYDELRSLDVRYDPIERIGGLALTRHELQLTTEVKEDYIWMNRTGVAMFEVIRETTATIHSVTGMRFASNAER
jgi:hypothetical protein